MILNSKPLTSLQESDLQELITNQVIESKTLDYKRDLPNLAKEGSKEFLADVSAFANTTGGYLVFGMDEHAGVPTNLCGVEISDADALKLRWESLFRDGISPQLPHYDIQVVELASRKQAIILHIPRSWLQPHRVILGGHGHFYVRKSSGKDRMDVPQLRAAFILSETLAERMRKFRTERLSIIASGETPIHLDEKAPKIVLHLIPFGAFESSSRYDLTLLTHPEQRPLIEPLTLWVRETYNRIRYRYNFDGLVSSVRYANDIPPVAYLQFFRNGIIETVDVSILSQSQDKKIPGQNYEICLCHALSLYLRVQQMIGIDLPVFAIVSLLGVEDYTISTESYQRYVQPEHPIDRLNLIVPEIMIDRFNPDPSEVLKPIFDTVWNAAGWSQSMNYDDTGKWKLAMPS